MTKQQLTSALSKYLPEEAVAPVLELILQHKVQLTVTPQRKSMNGTYRPPVDHKGHRISINGNLNVYAFLITLLHELAHLLVWDRYKNKVLPHGVEWKQLFKHLLEEYIRYGCFPEDVQQALRGYMDTMYASSCTDKTLMKTLAQYDVNRQTSSGKEEKTYFLEEVPEGAVFSLVEDRGRVFVKGEKLRKYFRCQELKSTRLYRVSPIAKVVLATRQNLN
ncbi:SprT-like domain-containing protein [Rapidithrix thailandica]|uniref:SprT-like domain-containing protein n=1 Tax=Rapidithrix thailandica TaxID=413964 RepID=A0AAW9RQX1_9BACT